MASPARDTALRILRCPICRLDLNPGDRSLVCARGHNFDLARSGYVNLMVGRRRRPAGGGDRRIQLERRNAFLKAGHFDFIWKAIVRRLTESSDVLDAAQQCREARDAGHLDGPAARPRPEQRVGLGARIRKLRFLDEQPDFRYGKAKPLR